MVLGVRPVLDQAPASGNRVVEAGEVADREDIRVVASQVLVDYDGASVEADA